MARNRVHYESRSIFFQTDSLYSRYKDSIYYARMFLEDLGTSIMPIGGRSFSGKPFSVSVTPNEQKQKIKINLLFPSEFHPNDRIHSTTEETVSGFIKDCAERLVMHGTQHYEIVPASINSKIVEEKSISTDPVYILIKISGRVVKIGGVYIQFVSKDLWGKLQKKFVILPASSVWQVTFPKNNSRIRSVDQTLRGLIIAGRKFQFQMKILDEGLFSNEAFDVKSYYRYVELYVAWLTRLWGWDLRSSLRRFSLEYYQIFRRIMFAYNLAVIREHIFKDMNSLLRKIGYGCQMEMAGIPTSFSLYELFSKLEKKEISFEEVFDLTQL